MTAARVAVPDAARLVLATRNAHKVVELRQILAAGLGAGGGHLDSAVVGVADLPGTPDVVESGVTFAQNALLKARAVCAATGRPAVADDSGLAVDVLGGAPGVFSARWAGCHGDDVGNLALLVSQLADVPDAHRGARFVAAAALVHPDGSEQVEHGELAGTLLREPRGTGGFGYDPLLLLPELGRSLAELDASAKNAISHRGRAVRALLPRLLPLLHPNG